MTDLRERVARALYALDSCNSAEHWWQTTTLREQYFRRADAALAATKLHREVYVLRDGVFTTEMEQVPATTDGRPCCMRCETPLDIPGRPWTEDCGGDCLACMADAGDPDCVEAMKTLLAVPTPPATETPHA